MYNPQQTFQSKSLGTQEQLKNWRKWNLRNKVLPSYMDFNYLFFISVKDLNNIILVFIATIY